MGIVNRLSFFSVKMKVSKPRVSLDPISILLVDPGHLCFTRSVVRVAINPMRISERWNDKTPSDNGIKGLTTQSWLHEIRVVIVKKLPFTHKKKHTHVHTHTHRRMDASRNTEFWTKWLPFHRRRLGNAWASIWHKTMTWTYIYEVLRRQANLTEMEVLSMYIQRSLSR